MKNNLLIILCWLFLATCNEIIAQDFSVRGTCTTELGLAIPNTAIKVFTATDSFRVLTDQMGGYAISTPDKIIRIGLPKKNDHPLNGISVVDLFKMRHHILYLERLLSPYQFLAGDINVSPRPNDCTSYDFYFPRVRNYEDSFSGVGFTTFDLVILSQYMLGIRDPNSFYLGWRYSPVGLVDFNSDQINLDFVGVKIGDVSGNAAPNNLRILETAQTRSSLPQLFIPEREVNEGEVIRIPFSFDGKERIAALQFSLAFNSEKMEYLGSGNGKLDLGQYGGAAEDLDEDGLLRIIYAGLESKEINNEVLFYFEFKAKEDFLLSEVIALNEKPLKTEIYYQLPNEKEYHSDHFSLVFKNNVITSNTKLNKDELGFGPNPIVEKTWIELPKKVYKGAQLSLFDELGQLHKQLVFLTPRLEFSRSQLKSGLYFYEIKNRFGKQIYSGKILVQ